MNVLYLTEHLSHADFLEHELGKIAPHIRIDVSPKIDDALARVATTGRYDAVLLDPVVHGAESLSLIANIRQQDLPLAVVALTGPADEDPPLKMLDAGADDYVVKRPNFVKNLVAILERLVEQRRTEGEKDLPPLEVLHTGEMERARRYFTRPSLVKFRAMTVGADGCCTVPSVSQGKFPYDAVVLDDAIPGINLLRALKDIIARAPDTPVILVVALGQDELATQGLKLGATEYILKTGDYGRRLATALESALRRRDLLREKAALRSTEARLRLIIETVPACVTLLTCEGTFQAINWTGLSMVGATRVDQVVGKNLFTLVGPKHENRLRSFISRVCAGERGVIDFDWEGLDGIPRRLELRATPLRRESESSPAVLGVINDLGTVSRKPEDASRPEAETGFSGLEDEQKSRQEQWAADRKKYEEERVAVLEAVRTLEARLAQAEARLKSEQDTWQATHRELEWQRTALEEALRSAEAGRSQLVEENQRARAEWEKSRQELEQEIHQAAERQAKLEDAARTTVLPPAEIVEQNRPEGAHWDIQHLEQERQLADSEGSRAEAERLHASIEELLRSLEMSQSEGIGQGRNEIAELEQSGSGQKPQPILRMDRVHESDALRAELEEQHCLERVEWDSACMELRRLRAEAEWKCAEEAKQRAAMEARCANLEDSHGPGEMEWETQRREWQQQKEVLGESIRGLEGRLAELAEQHRIEREEWDSACLELKRQHAESESIRAEMVGRRASLEAELRTLEAHSAAQEERYRSELATREMTHRQLEQRHLEAEARWANLEKTYARLDESSAARENQHRAEQAEWEHARQEQERLRRAAEEQRTALETVMRELTERHEELERQLRTERDTCDHARRELERLRTEADHQSAELASRRSSYEETLVALEARCGELELQYRSELAALEQARRDQEVRQQETEERRTVMEAATRELEARQELLERQRGEAERKRAEMENRNASLEAALQELKGRCAELEQQCRSVLAAAEETRREESERQREAEEQRAALEAIARGHEARSLEMNAQFQTEHAAWERARLELEREHAEADGRCAALEEALRSLNARCADLDDQCRMERAERVQVIQDLEKQRHELATKNGLLEKACAALEALKSELVEKQKLERANWERLRAELEQQRAVRVALEETLRASEARGTELLEGQRIERAEAQTAREELERQRTARLASEEALRTAEARLSQLEAGSLRERSELEALCQELERQRAARLALEGALRVAESRQQTEHFSELAASAMQALSELVMRMNDYGELLLQCLEADDPRRVRAQRLVEIAGHAGSLAGRLLALGPRQDLLDLNSTVTQMAGPLRSLAGENAELLTILSPRQPRIRAARPQVDQLLNALVLHARKSLPLGGTITIETVPQAEDGAAGTAPEALLAVSASAPNVEAPSDTSALEPLVAACGGKMSTHGDAVTGYTLEVALPAEP
jgi:DNA-binding response OmpR family regulator